MRTRDRWIRFALPAMALAILFLAGTALPALAEYQMLPQYDKKGKIGTRDKSFGEMWTEEFGTHGPIYRIPYVVDSYTDFSAITTEGGASVFVIDPLDQRVAYYQFDLQAVYESCTPAAGVTSWRDALTGVTAGFAPVTELADDMEVIVECVGTGTTPVYLWQPTEDGAVTGVWSGVTVAGTLRALDLTGNWVTGASTYRLDAQGDRQRFRLDYGAGVSIQQIADFCN